MVTSKVSSKNENIMSEDVKKAKEAEEEALSRKYEEETFNRNAKAGLHADACTTPLKMARGHMRRKPLIKQVTCQKCGKIFKTNRDTNLCFKCEKKK